MNDAQGRLMGNIVCDNCGAETVVGVEGWQRLTLGYGETEILMHICGECASQIEWNNPVAINDRICRPAVAAEVDE